MIRVLVPSQLHAYTGGVSRLEAAGATIDAVFDDLDRRFPGLRFRVIDEQARVRRTCACSWGVRRRVTSPPGSPTAMSC
jgi:hypothetical protein